MNAARVPELVPSAWIDGDEVVIHDRINHSPGRIHVRVIGMAWHCANQRDTARATVNGRSYHRDALRMALDLVEAIPLCANRFHVGADAPGTSPDGWCTACDSAAAAMSNDDRSEF